MLKTTIDAELVVEAAERSDCHVRGSYSGRGMYGDTCFGIVHPGGAELAKFFMALAERDADLAWELADRMSADSMGYDTITYFRGYGLDGEVDEDGEGDW